jgi:hypothetical protein
LDDAGAEVDAFQSPRDIENNGYWLVNKTNPDINGAQNVTTIRICLTSSGALANLEYYACLKPGPSLSPTVTPRSPSASPETSRRTELPTRTPRTRPPTTRTSEPTASPNVDIESIVPTPNGPTDSPSPQTCEFIRCDFATLAVASFMSNPAQTAKILRDCGISSVTAEDPEGAPRNVNVFDSADIKGTETKYDPDLGAPNRACGLVNGKRGPGIGAGGRPTAPFPNCLEQGNLLIIQNTNNTETDPNDSPLGGCMIFDFARKMNLFDMGLLDVEESIQILVVSVACPVSLLFYENFISFVGLNISWLTFLFFFLLVLSLQMEMELTRSLPTQPISATMAFGRFGQLWDPGLVWTTQHKSKFVFLRQAP